MRPFFLLLILLLHTSLIAKPYAVFVNIDYGFFSIFRMALSICQSYEKGVLQGFEFDFKKIGLYYDPLHGENWWQYYFEPVHCGTKEGGDIQYVRKIRTFNVSRDESHQLIQKYLHVKPHILEIVRVFEEKNFHETKIIGVHYRGTDKITEAQRVSYEKMGSVLEKESAKYKNTNWKIFVATDEMGFLEYLREKFPNRVCCTSSQRSEDGQPIHKSPPDRYKSGEEALVDCLLLSRCHLLLRTASNLSEVATFFNPALPVILVNG